MTKSRIFLFLLLAFVAGVALRSFTAVSVFMIWAGLAAGAMVAVSGLWRKNRNLAVYGFLLVALVAGVFRFEQVENLRPDLAEFYGKPFAARGVIHGEPEQSEKVQRIKVKIESLDGRSLNRPFYALVTLRKYPEYKIGDELEIQGLIEEPTNYRDFDYISYLERDDIFSVISFPLVEKIGENRGPKLKLILSRLKRAFEEKIDSVLPEPHAAFLKGLLLGERESLPQDLVENFKRTGTTHIVALSGYNITMVGRFFVGGLLLLTVPFRFSFWLATVGIFLFVILTGASPSVVRAGIMGILVLLAQREGRAYHMVNALVFAGAIMVFQNPKILRFDVAFQLSFLATAGLIYLAPPVEKFIDSSRNRLGFSGRSLKRPESFSDKYRLFPLKQIFVETLSAQIMVLPLLIYLFGRVSLISPLSNILVLIAVPYAMLMGFLTGFLGFISTFLGQVAGGVTWVLLEYQIRIIEFFAKIPLASVSLGSWTVVFLFFWYAYILWKLMSRKTPV